MENGEKHNEQSREIALDVLRGIAILIVVLGHAIQSSLLEGESSFIWSRLILNFQMPLLFCISGYSAGFSFPSDDTKKFIVKKIKRLLIPYVAWESLHYLVVCIVTSDYNMFEGISFIKEFFISDFWFLRVLFIYYVVLWIYNILFSLVHIKNKMVQSLLLLSGCAIVWLLTKIKLINGSLSVWYYVWFIIGLLFFIYKNYINSLIHNTKKVSCVGSIFITLLVIFAIVKNVSTRIITVLLVAQISMVVYASVGVMPEKIRTYLIHVGKNTLPVYGIHWCLLFSPVFRVNGYQCIRNVLALYPSAIFISIMWVVISEVLILILSKSNMGRKIFLGVG